MMNVTEAEIPPPAVAPIRKQTEVLLVENFSEIFPELILSTLASSKVTPNLLSFKKPPPIKDKYLLIYF